MSAIRRTLPVLLLALAAVAPIATQAAPTPKVPPLVIVELDHNAVGRRMFLSKLQQSTTEPGGFEISSSTPAEWLDLGFKIGDRILAENGSPVGERLFVNDGIHLFQVIRNDKPLLLELIIHPGSHHTHTMDEAHFDKLMDIVADPDPRSAPVRNAAGPSGVRVIDTLLSLYVECEVGDVIRMVDGLPIHTDAELTAALKSLRIGATDIVVDRLDRPVTLTLIRKAPLDLTGIKKLAPTRFEVTRTFADAVLADHDLLIRKLDASPYLKNGKHHGFTVYNIQKDAPAAVLGLLDGDVVLDVDGHSIDSFRDVLDAVSELQSANGLTLHIERKGKALAIAYAVK